MARRMFSDEITTTDAFLDMPSSSQLLYFHLGMSADDDGFIGSPKMIMRTIGASVDDYRLLISKKFVLVFESGICVIKHWRINNQIRKDIYQETKYFKERLLLRIKKNGSYTFNEDDSIFLPKGHFTLESMLLNKDNFTSTERQQDVTLGKVSIGKVSKDNTILVTPSTEMTEVLFDSLKWTESLLEDTKEHINLIGSYFYKYTTHNFPTKEVANAELRKNMKPAAYLVKNFKPEDIKKTLEYCKKEFKDVHWNLSTVQKQISFVTAKKYD